MLGSLFMTIENNIYSRRREMTFYPGLLYTIYYIQVATPLEASWSNLGVKEMGSTLKFDFSFGKKICLGGYIVVLGDFPWERSGTLPQTFPCS